MCSARTDLSVLFNPRSVAVIGASRNKTKIGYIALKNIIDSGYKGGIYPVNPFAKTILGLKVYSDVSEITENVDLAIISLPATLVLDMVLVCANKGIKNILIYSAGFKELGEEGKKLEQKLAKIAEDEGLNILGPNCLGYLNNINSINTTFGELSNIKGNLHFISQSGAIASSLFDYSKKTGLGFGYFVTLGNKTVITENEVLRFLKNNVLDNENKSTLISAYQPVGLYLESISDGREFLKVVKDITKNNPVFILKPGKSTEAQKAMQSHTGSLAGEDFVIDTAFKQFGVVRCEEMEDLFDMAKAFSWENAPKGQNIAIISNAGGPGVITADAVSRYGLKLADLSEKTIQFLKKYLPREASTINPIDVLGDALVDRYKAAIQAVLANKNADCLLVILTPQLLTEVEKTAKIIGELAKKYNKPVMCSFIGGSKTEKGEEILNKYKIPSFKYPERAVKAFAAMWYWENYRQHHHNGIFNTKIEEKSDFNISNRKVLYSSELNKVFQKNNISVPKDELVDSFSKALNFAETIKFPVVLKISSEKLLHKTELNAVITNIKNHVGLEKSFHYLSNIIKSNDLKDAKIQVQQQIKDGVEVIVGVKKDASFGHVLFFGAGGIFVELIKDRNMKILPASEEEIKEMVMNSKIYSLLQGYRGSEPYAINELCKLIYNLSQVALSIANIKEIEINPVIVTKDKAWAVDAKGILV